MKLVKDAVREWKAEVVFITSNYQGNSEIMEGCKEAGIPAFVSIRHPLLLISLSDDPTRALSGTSDHLHHLFESPCIFISYYPLILEVFAYSGHSLSLLSRRW
jgi:hypothetical protein